VLAVKGNKEETLRKVEKHDSVCDDINTYFGLKVEAPLETLSTLHFAFQCIELSISQGHISAHESLEVREWVRHIYLGFQDQQTTIEILQKLDDHLLLNSSLVSHSLTFADIFMISCLNRSLGVLSPADLALKTTKTFANINRHLNHINNMFKSCFEINFECQETRLFGSMKKNSTSGQFVNAFKAGDLSLCSKILESNPKAVREKDSEGLSAVHFATTISQLKWLQAYDEVDFDQVDG